jgi:dihydrofolate reductase
MSRIVVTEFVSLDGVMEEPRWTFQFERGPDGGKFKYDELFGSAALLLGRVTYQAFAQAWPSMGTDEFGQRMNSIPKYVVSSTLADVEATWGETTLIRGDVVAEIAKLRAALGGDRLMVFPIILGAGKRLFPDQMNAAATLTLTDSKTDRDGVLLLTYHPAPAGTPAGQPDPAA